MRGTGRVHIYYGYGKGKTTAAIGATVRAAGASLKVLFYQFLKDNSSSERVILEEMPNVTCLPGKEHVKFYTQMNGDEKKEYRRYYTKALDEIVKFCSGFDVLVLDEILDAVALGVISEQKVLSFIDHKPRGLELVLTGHDISEEMRARGHYITYFEKEKHPYDLGIIAREGIEY